MAVLLERANDALNVNPPAGDAFLTENGSNWLFAATALFLLSFLTVIMLTHRKPGADNRGSENIFHYILAIALFVAGITYFAYASDLGYDVVQQIHNQDINGTTRQIFWVKFVNWVVEFPAIILVLGLLSGISWTSMIYQIFLSWIWILNYTAASYVVTTYKWGFYAFGTFAMILLLVNIFLTSRKTTYDLGTRSHHTLLFAHTAFFWIMYPIAFGLDIGNRIGGTGSAIWYGILDVLLLVGVTVVTLVLSRKWDYNRMNISFTQHGRGHFGSHLGKGTPAASHHEHGHDAHHNNGHHAAAPVGTTSQVV